MAGTSNNQFNSHLYLSPNQQDLLLAALNSNNPSNPNNPNNPPAKSATYPPGSNIKRSDSNHQQQYPLDGMDPSFFTSPHQGTSSDFGNFGVEESPYVDFLDPDAPFDFDPNDTGDLLIGGLPGDQQSTTMVDGEVETHDKRKSPEDDNEEDEEGSAKRREGEDKVAKKPGRKPLTSEPSTKRKAQNRAAQRAFRERKEKHLKDLETKVSELEKQSDAANHENGLLRAQVQRLQAELREYRKRLSLNSTGVARPSSTTAGFPSLLSHTAPGANNFQFEFPRFGTLPGSQIFADGANGNSAAATNSTPKPSSSTPARQNSVGRSMSPGTQQNGVHSPTEKNSPGHQAVGTDNASGFFSPLNGVNNNNPSTQHPTTAATKSARGSTSSSTGQSRVFQFNSNSTSTNDSPSVSSVSHYGSNSSCGTSPEPSHSSPGNDKTKDAKGDGYTCHATSEGEITFCEKLNMACGNPRNPVPRAMSQSNGTPAAATSPNNNTNDFGIDWLANQNENQFNPALFGDYRESQAAVVGDGDFTGGFFSEAFPTTDFGSPFNFGENTPAAPKVNPLDVIEKIQDGGDEEVVPGEDPTQLLSCHKIWDKLQNRQDFKDGTIDIDSLCTELRAKARCSESGVVVDTKDVEAALKRLPEHMGS